MSSSHFPKPIELPRSQFFLTLDLPPNLFHLFISLHSPLLAPRQSQWSDTIITVDLDKSLPTSPNSPIFSYSQFGDTANIAYGSYPIPYPGDTTATPDFSLLKILVTSSMLPLPTLQLLQIWVTSSTLPTLITF